MPKKEKKKFLRVSLNEMKSDPSELVVNSWAAFRLAALNDKKQELQEERRKLKRQRDAFKHEMERRKAELQQMSQDALPIPITEEVTEEEEDDNDISYKKAEPKSSLINGPILSFHNLTYEIKLREHFLKRSTISRTILQGVSGLLLPGMNAIMGPTGCGKTTLLDLLAGRKDMSKVKGTILVNGYKQPNYFKCIAGYVVQDDVLLGTLTVRESIMFSANTRLPADVSQEEKRAKVDKVLNDLGLMKCADTKVGNELIRGVSGGERKRTCIGMELIVSPSILFLDEPTTGLDASTANSVMSLLHTLSRQGLTIIFSIHQPRYSIFKLFDGLILLAAGSIIYHGPAANALDFFQLQKFNIESFNNPPDFFLDVINGDVQTVTLSTSITEDDDEANFIKAVQTTDRNMRKNIIIEKLTKKYKETYWHTRIERNLNRKMKIFLMNPKYVMEGAKYATSLRRQLKYVTVRSILNVVRNPAASLSQIGMTIFFSLIVGVFYWNMNLKYPEAIQNRSGAFFFVVMIQLFGNMSAVEVFLKERVIFLHEIHSGFYRVSVFFFSKIFCDLIPLRIVPMILFASITYWMTGLERDAYKFGCYFLTLFLTTFVSAILTFVISASVKVLALANIYVGLCYIIMMLFGGLLVNLKSMSPYVRWAEYTSIVRFSFNALLINEIKGATYYVYVNDTIVQNLTTAGDDYLDAQGISHSSHWDFWHNHMALGLIASILIVICYLELRFIVLIRG